MAEKCQNCGQSYETVYRVSDKVWWEVSPRGPRSGLLCLPCADTAARKIGIILYWEAKQGSFPTDKAPT